MPLGSQIQSMFSRIAGRYDLLNHVLSMGMDFYWWRAMARASGAKSGLQFLDVAAGTGDSTIALARRGATVVTSDFTLSMLHQGPAKFVRTGVVDRILGFVGADALCLPFVDASFDGITICYGIRNMEDRPKAFLECLRLLKPGCPLTILEFSKPRWAWLRGLYKVYLSLLLPRLGGWISGDSHAYCYLPKSIQAFPDQLGLASELEAAGFRNVRWTNLTGGIVAVHVAEKS